MEIELIYSPGCQNLDSARNNLRAALKLSGNTTTWQEIDLDLNVTAAHYRKFGSPTILINGKDIANDAGDHQSGT
jgi:mercuric ion transport protein